MELYTSYFGALKKLPIDDYEIVAITASSPKWFTGKTLSVLAPDIELVMGYKSGNICKSEYEKIYTAKLERVNIRDYMKLFEDKARDKKGIIFLCYEKPDDFCHRHIFAKYFSDRGYPIKEYTTKKARRSISLLRNS